MIETTYKLRTLTHLPLISCSPAQFGNGVRPVLSVESFGFSEAGLLTVGADNFEFSVAEPQKQIMSPRLTEEKCSANLSVS